MRTPLNNARALVLVIGVLVLTLIRPLPASAANDYPWPTADQGQMSVLGFNYRNCTNFVAWRLNTQVGVQSAPWRFTWSNLAGPGGNGHAIGWKDGAISRGYRVDTTPAVGAVAWWGSSHGGGLGHVAIVTGVNPDGSVSVEQYNQVPFEYSTQDNVRAEAYLHIADVSSDSTILSVKRTAGPDGVRQVYAATRFAVTEGWWIPGGDGVHRQQIIAIAQGDIRGFDKVNLPDGGQAVYTAVTDGVWETWWRPGIGPQSSKIVSGLPDVRQVIAYNSYESGTLVHHVYLLTQAGPYEVWWRDGGDGVHVSLLNSINNPVTMTKSTGPAGTEQLYVATPTWVYELWWWPGSSEVHSGPILNITQGDIRSLSKGDTIGTNGQLLYTSTSTTAWQSYWAFGTGITHGTIATGQAGAIQIEKTVTGGTHQLYLATGDHVQEYWWNESGSGGGELIRISQNNIKAFDKFQDGSIQQLYTAQSDTVWETWWGNGTGPTSSVLFRVLH